MGDSDEDIDTAEIEEDLIEYMKTSTRLAEEKMRTINIPCWIVAHKKMRNGDWQWGSLLNQRQDGPKKQQNELQASALDAKQAEQWEDGQRGGKTTSVNSSSLRKQKKPRETIWRTTTHGYG